MILHYVKVAIRVMKKRPGLYFINVLGLAVGIAACLFITQYVQFNKSFDKQSPYYPDTYRVLYSRWMQMGDEVAFASCSPPVGPVLKQQFPEVLDFARMYRVEGVFFHEDIFFEEEKVFFSESPIFELLGIPLSSGSCSQCLDEPGQVAVSRSTARRYFGEADPIGKLIFFNKKDRYEVTAVFEDMPANMHFQANMFLSLSSWDRQHPGVLENGWVNSGFYTYIRLLAGTDPEKINQGIDEYVEEHMGEALAQSQMGFVYRLQPLTDIHLGSRLMHELRVNGDKATLNLLAIVSWFILLIAWVNFFNLTTIASIKRLREIGIRKVSGAQRKQLLEQFFTESVLVNIMAMLIALLLVEVFRHPFYEFAGLPKGLGFYSQPWFPLVVGIAFLVGTVSAGVYSGLGITGNNLVNILKGTQGPVKGKSGMRRILVAFQFMIAIALIAATTGVYLQYQHMLKRDLGFELQGRLVLKAPVVGEPGLPLRFNAFRNELKQIDGVQNASFSSVIPGKSNMFNRGGFYRMGDQPGNSKNIRVTEADIDFFETLGIPFIEGEGFTGIPDLDRDRVVINLNAALLLGFEDARDATGQIVFLGQRELFISGVVVDFFQLSPKEIIEPQMFWQPVRNLGYFTISYDNKPLAHMLQQIEPLYGRFFPGNPFDYFFLDDYYFAQFEHDRRFGMVFALFSLLVIMVTIVGLIGLSAFTAEQRRKEIGIRKVLGASQHTIFMLLFRDYLVLWLVAALIAVPAVVSFLGRWLDGFAVRMQIEPGMFLIPLLLVLCISLFTVWGVSRKIISLNPVENIGYE